MTRKHSVKNIVTEISKTEQADIGLKAKLHGACNICTASSKADAKSFNFARKDPTGFEFILNERAKIKNKRKPREWNDCATGETSQGMKLLNKLMEEGIDITSPMTPRTQEKRRVAKRHLIVEKLMEGYEQYMLELEEASRPRYIDLCETAIKLAKERKYARPYENKIQAEQLIRESMHRDIEELNDFREEVSRHWKGDFDSFVDALLTIEEEIAENERYQSETRRLSFVTKNPFERKEEADLLDDQILDTFTAQRNRQQFLTTKTKQAFMPKFTKPQEDSNLELAKQLAANNGLPNPSIIANPEKSPVDAERLVIMG